MARKLLFLLFLVVLFGLFITAKVFWWDKRSKAGYIKIVSTPSATVFIDNVAINKTPLTEKREAGEYMVKLIPAGEATISASWMSRVPVYQNATTYINRELGLSDTTSAGEVISIMQMAKTPLKPDAGEVVIESDPPGALAMLDNKEKGLSNITISEVDKGDHEVSLYLTNFKRRTFRIRVEAGYTTKAQVKLALDEGATKNASESATVTPGVGTPTEEKPEAGTKATGTVTIKDTPTGFLRVRASASVQAKEVGRVNPGDKFALLEETSEWYKIEYEKGQQGWISAGYAEKN